MNDSYRGIGIKGLTMGLLFCSALTSCFKEEPLNAECDIEAVSFHIDNPLGTFFSVTDTLQRVASADSTVTFNVRRNHDVDLSTLVPKLTLTAGATAVPTGGSLDAETGGRLTYRVTSEDQRWHRNYTIVVQPIVRTVSDTVMFDFEHFELESREQRYYIWHNVMEDGTLGNDWANGNPGFRLSMSSASPEDYPSVPLANGYDGYGIQLITRSTGPFGAMAGKRLAAGNFFLGTFDVTKALTNALQATAFGVPFDREPVTMTGYYQYVPGATYQDKNGNAVVGRTDKAAVYAVFYRNHDDAGNTVVLHGDDVKTNAHIIALADMGEVPVTNTWTPFTINFSYTEAVDYDLLANRGYSLAIVFSSSNEGDRFEGAIGSRLCIDKVRVTCKKEE